MWFNGPTLDTHLASCYEYSLSKVKHFIRLKYFYFLNRTLSIIQFEVLSKDITEEVKELRYGDTQHREVSLTKTDWNVLPVLPFLINFKNPTRNWSIFLILKQKQKMVFTIPPFLFYPFFHLLIWFVFFAFLFFLFLLQKTSKRWLGDWWYVLNHFW